MSNTLSTEKMNEQPQREQDSRALPCSLCGVAPHLPELRTDASGNHSTAAIIGCGCGVQVRVECGNRYAARPGDSGWSMIGGNWDMSLREAVEKWNLLHKANDQVQRSSDTSPNTVE